MTSVTRVDLRRRDQCPRAATASRSAPALDGVVSGTLFG